MWNANMLMISETRIVGNVPVWKLFDRWIQWWQGGGILLFVREGIS